AAGALVTPLDPGEATEERAEIALDEDLPDARWPPVRKEDLGARRPFAKAVGKPFDRGGEARVHRKAVAELDRRREHFCKGETAVPRESREPGIGRGRSHRALDADRH